MLNYRISSHHMIDIENGFATASVFKYSNGDISVKYRERADNSMCADYEFGMYYKTNTFDLRHIEVRDIILEQCGIYIPLKGEEEIA